VERQQDLLGHVVQWSSGSLLAKLLSSMCLWRQLHEVVYSLRKVDHLEIDAVAIYLLSELSRPALLGEGGSSVHVHTRREDKLTNLTKELKR